MTKTFVFMHVSREAHDPLPSMLSVSIRRSCPDARIIQCSDQLTEKTNEADEVFRIDDDPSLLMSFRLSAFSKLGLDEAAIYLDTDMLVLFDIDPNKLIGDHDICVCRRSQDRDLPFNPNFKDMNLSQYEGLTTDEVYPYVACFTITKNFQFWRACYEQLKTLDSRFERWYGDQEAIKKILLTNAFSFQELSESVFGCLPEYFDANNPAKVVHFKGPHRKLWMTDVYNQVFV